MSHGEENSGSNDNDKNKNEQGKESDSMTFRNYAAPVRRSNASPPSQSDLAIDLATTDEFPTYNSNNNISHSKKRDRLSNLERRKKTSRSSFSLSWQRLIVRFQMLPPVYQFGFIVLLSFASCVFVFEIFMSTVANDLAMAAGNHGVDFHPAATQNQSTNNKFFDKELLERHRQPPQTLHQPKQELQQENMDATDVNPYGMTTLEKEGLAINSILFNDMRRFTNRKTFSSKQPRVVLINDDNKGDMFSLGSVVSIASTDASLPGEGVRELKKRYIELRLTNPKELKQASGLYKGDCEPVAPEWQLADNPTCNLLHEASSGWQTLYQLPIFGAERQDTFHLPDSLPSDDNEEVQNQSRTDSKEEKEPEIVWGADEEAIHQSREQARFINAGAFRQVWMIREFDGITKKVMKTLEATSKSKKFDLRNQDRHRRDALAFDQLTTSPLVVNMYGYCSNSALFDYADGGDLYGVFDKFPDLTKKDMLDIAYNISLSVHHAHNFDSKGRATMAHTDIKPDQFIYQDGYYRLSDFNRVRFLMWNQKRDLQCGFRVAKNGGEYRAPEEYAYDVETEKVDVYSLGNVLYWLLTGKEPWHDYQTRHVYQLVKMGQRPKIPDQIYNSTGVFERYMIQAIEKAWIHDFQERPGALEVANTIKEGLDILSTGLEG